MNTTDMLWFTELCADFHFTNTANRLFISQQTLSNHMARLEKELGAQLIYRQPTASLTPAGEAFYEFCIRFLEESYLLRDQLSVIKKEERGTIHLGASHYRLSSSFPHVITAFSKRFPEVNFELHESTSARLEEMTSEGLLHYCIVLASDENPNLNAKLLMMDKIYVCVTEKLLEQYYSEEEIKSLKKRMRKGLEVKDLIRLPFCMLNNRMGQMVGECFHEADLTPHVFMTSTHMRISMKVCREGLAACFITQAGLADEYLDLEGIHVFPLLHENKQLSQKVVLLNMRKRKLPSYAVVLSEMLQEYFKELESKDLVHIAE